ncbi:MAG: AAA family ATPase [Euryarchaeota archaeon]|nr:AAA family ATPase [Euryarchaeota archaeon]
MTVDVQATVRLRNEPPFVGRRAEQSELSSSLARLREGRGGAWRITGPEGIGKSRLARWLADQALQDHLDVRWAHGLSEGGVPFFLFEQLLRDPADDHHDLASVPMPPSLAKYSLAPAARMMAYLDRLDILARKGAALLILDDLQWADDASVRALQFLVRNSRDRPVLWVACERSDPDTTAPTRLGEVFQRLETEGALSQLRLRGMSPEELSEVLRGVTQPPLDLEAGDGGFRRFLLKTAGNPHFALAALRLMYDQGRLRPEEGRIVVEAPPRPEAQDGASWPETLRQATEGRLALLGPEELRFLSIAALLGKDFELTPLQEVSEPSREALRHRARGLETLHGLIRPVFGGRDRWTFTEGMAADLALGKLPTELRRSAARKLGDWWAEHRPEDVEQVARLYHDAGDGSLAAPWITKAIDRAALEESAEPVERYVQWARDLGSSDPAATASRGLEEVRVARSLRRFGANAPALRILRSIPGEGLPLGVARERDLAVIDVLTDLDPREAHDRLRQLEQLVDATPTTEVPPLFHARLCGTRAYLARVTGAFPEGLAAAEKALTYLDASMDPRERARALYEAGWCALELEKWDLATHYFERNLEVGRSANLLRSQASALGGLGGVAFLMGKVREAREHFESAVRLQREGGELSRIVPLLLNLSEVAVAEGDLRRAWGHHEEASRLADRFDLPRWRASAAGQRGLLLLRERRWEEAQRALELGRELTRPLGARMYLEEVEIGLAWARGERGDPQGAMATLDPLERGPPPLAAQHADFFYEVRGRLKAMLSDPSGARADLDQALGRAGPSLVRRAHILGDLSAWEVDHGDAEHALELRAQADDLYHRSGVDPEKARVVNEVFVGSATAPTPSKR